MDLHIYFDSTEINSNGIVGLSQSGEGFSESFKLGTTVCRTVELLVLKSYVSSQPTTVTIYHDSDLYLTLHVESVDDTNDAYYKYELADAMILFNKVIEFSDGTAQSVLNTICSGICTTATLSSDIGNTPVEFSNNYSAREFIGFIAELYGGYAYITDENILAFATYTNTSVATIAETDCSGFILGSQVLVDKVVYSDSIYAGTGSNVLYLNTSNVLIKDWTGHTKQSITTAIYNLVNGLSFYNVSVGYISPEYPLHSILPNATITIAGYRTLWQCDLTFNGKWLGGQKLNIESSEAGTNTLLAGDVTSTVNSLKTRVSQTESDIVLEATARQNADTALSGRITTNADNITAEVSRAEGAETTLQSNITVEAGRITQEVTDRTSGDSALSSRIEQCAESITLSVGTSSGKSTGITITTTKEDGSTETSSGTITLSGDVVVKSNLTDGTTTISGDNITTGTIDASQATISNINASNINSGTLSADRISAGTITANKLKVNGETVGSSSSKYTRLFTTNLSVIDGSIYIATSAGVGVTLSNTGVSTTTGYSDTWADIITKTATFG